MRERRRWADQRNQVVHQDVYLAERLQLAILAMECGFRYCNEVRQTADFKRCRDEAKWGCVKIGKSSPEIQASTLYQ